MRYRNTLTGAEIEVNSEIIAPNWEKLGAPSPEVVPQIIPEEKHEEKKPKTAPKKTTKRTRK